MYCAECEDFEFREAHPARSLLRSIGAVAVLCLPKPRVSPLASMGAGMASVMRAAIGVREPTHYERHQRAWIETGDSRELERMLRQVR